MNFVRGYPAPHYYAGANLCDSRAQSRTHLGYAEMKQSVRSKRVAARIGSGGLSYDATCVTDNGEVAKRSDKLFWEGLKTLNEHKTKPEDFAGMSLVNARGKEVDWLKKIDLDKLAMSWQLEAKIDPWKIHSVIDDNSYPAMPGNSRYESEPDVYFYHSDHLGSASWITDSAGIAVQHLQYLPYGEPYIDQRAAGTTYRERFRFTGKEKDEETGYGYFGARYMDHVLTTMWLSVDPMSDKYPNSSPYNYCMWNPVKLVDPDGRQGQLPRYGTFNNRPQRFVYSNIRQTVYRQSCQNTTQYSRTGCQNLFHAPRPDSYLRQQKWNGIVSQYNRTSGPLKIEPIAKFIANEMGKINEMINSKNYSVIQTETSICTERGNYFYTNIQIQFDNERAQVAFDDAQAAWEAANNLICQKYSITLPNGAITLTIEGFNKAIELGKSPKERVLEDYKRNKGGFRAIVTTSRPIPTIQAVD